MTQSVPSSPESATPDARERLDGLLTAILRQPERRDELATQIEDEFTERRAIMVLDMSGFSRTTQVHGVVAFLVMIRQMQLIAIPVVEAHRGVLLKAEADNLYCLFDNPGDAAAAARAIMTRLAAANVDLPDYQHIYASIGIGYGDILVLPGEDMYGDEVNLASKLGEDVALEGDVLLTESARAALDPAVVTAEARASISGLTLVYHALG